MTKPVAIIMGSQSDWATMRHAAETLDALGVAYDKRIVSAHRTPDRLVTLRQGRQGRGLQGHHRGRRRRRAPARHDGVDDARCRCSACRSNRRRCPASTRCYSIVQMPAGIPVGTLAIGTAGAINAALLAASVLALHDAALAERLDAWRKQQTDAVAETRRRTRRDPRTVPSRSARRHHRHSRRRPARPHAGARGRAARASSATCCARTRTRRRSTWCAA